MDFFTELIIAAVVAIYPFLLRVLPPKYATKLEYATKWVRVTVDKIDDFLTRLAESGGEKKK